MAYQLLALDLDGTILQDDHTLNPAVKRVIDQIKAHYHVMIVTGRHHTAAKPYYDELGLTTPIICCNGTYSYDYHKKSVIKHNGIPRNYAAAFLKMAQHYQLQIVLYTQQAMTYSASNPIPYMLPLTAWAKRYPKDKQPEIYPVETFEPFIEQSDYVWKFVVQSTSQNLQTFLAEPLLRDYFDGAWSDENRIDLTMKGNSKGHALASYLTSLNLKPEQAVSAGDNFNDVSMLSLAGVGIAMQHAHDDVKAAANMVTQTDNQGESLANLIAHYFPVQ